ncbi:CaiB/BaiF CoA transferase family protein [Streptomyces solisilvae]|uniref:CaiB/BaiF CoA transferase family protein n=1 Tax=Streptomyces malaysiensis TaxID=92644 RepID=UPI003677875C
MTIVSHFASTIVIAFCILFGMTKPPPSPPLGPQALEGLLVADFSRVLAGPYLTMLLSDLGATVIKVESPQGDQTRGWGPPYANGHSTYFQGLNRGKQSVVLDLAEPEQQELAIELARRCDILVHNFVPGGMERFGLGYDAVAAINPRAIYCSLSAFGSDPAAAGLAGFDLVAQAVGGLMSITGEADGAPTKVGVAVVDVLCGLHAGIGVLAALSARERSGRGQHVEVNLMMSILSALTNQAAGFLMAGVVPQRAGNAHPSVAPYEVFTLADGDIVIAAGTDEQYVRLCAALQLDRYRTDPRFATNSQRVIHRRELVNALTTALSARKCEDVLAALTAARVPAGRVNNLDAAFDLARSLGLDPVWRINDLDHVRTPISMDVTPPSPTTPPPEHDESGDTIRDWLRSAHLLADEVSDSP